MELSHAKHKVIVRAGRFEIGTSVASAENFWYTVAMITININDISRDLPGYLQRLPAGETILITQDDKPVAELKSVTATPGLASLRPFGLCAGEFVVPDDFDAPLPGSVLANFEGI